MDAARELGRHPAIRAGIGTAVGYGMILVLLLVLLFLIPYALFVLL